MENPATSEPLPEPDYGWIERRVVAHMLTRHDLSFDVWAAAVDAEIMFIKDTPRNEITAPYAELYDLGKSVGIAVLEALNAELAQARAEVERLEAENATMIEHMARGIVIANGYNPDGVTSTVGRSSQRPSPNMGRKEIARIIDPVAAEMEGRITASVAINHSYSEQWQIALAKADTLLAHLYKGDINWRPE